MAKNNFDDFLLDPSFDDLDKIHLEAERQLYENGGTRADRRIARAVKKGKLEKAARISKRAGNREARKEARKIRKGPLTKAIKNTSELSKNTKKTLKKNVQESKKVQGPVNKPLVKKTKPEDAAPQGATNAPGKTKTKRGTGVTYEDAWRANKNNVKSKYANYAAFKKAAQDWNKKNVDNKPKKTTSNKTTTKKKNTATSTISSTEKKKLLSKNLADKIPTGGSKMGYGGLKKMKYKKGGKR
tara:strand:+ start:1405 stop:2130 length:726 start_codon:yes stop_codon:yes gene_type:complete